MKTILLSILLLLNLSIQAQEQFRTSHFNWSPKTQSIQKEIFYFNPETNQKEWVKTESYVFYNTYLDTMVVDLGNAKEVTECNYNIDGNLKVKYTYYLQSETQDKTLFFYDKELQLTKSQEFVQGRLFSETKYSYDKQNRFIKSVCREKETGFSEITEYSNYTSDDSYTKTSYYNEGKKEANLSVEIYKNGLLIEANYQIFDLKSKIVYQYDEKRNVISEQKDNESPTLYQYEYDAEGNPTKITITNAQNPYLNSEIIVKSTYSEFLSN
jgi:YD repeat-containing protein